MRSKFLLSLASALTAAFVTNQASAYQVFAKLHSEDGSYIHSPRTCSSKIGSGGNYVYGSSRYPGKCQGAGQPPTIVAKNADSHFLRFRVNPDYVHRTEDNRDRAELAVTSQYIPFKQNTYISFRLRIPSNTSVTNDFFYILQLWQCSPASPIGGVRLSRGTSHKINFMARGQNGDLPSIPLDLKPGTWHKVLIAFRADPDGDGSLKVWVDKKYLGGTSGVIGHKGNSACQKDGVAITAPQHFRPKFGIYKGNEPGRYFEINMDNVRITDTFKSAVPW